MHRRESLSILRALYDFVEGSYWRHSKLWESARYEAYIPAGVLPLCYCDFSKGWCSTVSAVDASPTGWGACTTTLPTTTVASLGEWSERWRFRRLRPEEWAPRRRVQIEPLDALNDPASVLPPPVLSGTSIPRASNLDWVSREGFPDPPDLRKWTWETEDFGRWRFSEHITQLEGRAFCTHLSRFCLNTEHHDKEILIFVDSNAVALAMGKGRASSFSLLQSCRRAAA